ncbi:MAG: hypothetical protein Q8P20_05920 [bacterium]|nr:hypothetical protein [bacterium]
MTDPNGLFIFVVLAQLMLVMGGISHVIYMKTWDLDSRREIACVSGGLYSIALICNGLALIFTFPPHIAGFESERFMLQFNCIITALLSMLMLYRGVRIWWAQNHPRQDLTEVTAGRSHLPVKES